MRRSRRCCKGPEEGQGLLPLGTSLAAVRSHDALAESLPCCLPGGQRVLGPAASGLAWLMGNSPRGLEEGTHLSHQAQRGLVQSQHERPQILQSP